MILRGENKELSLKKRRRWAKEVLSDYLSNPENPTPRNRGQYCKILGCNANDLRHLLSADDFLEIECMALDLRRKLFARRLMRVDDALFQKAEEGDISGIKLVYQRFEGWGEKTISENNNTLTLTLDPELKAMLEQGRNGAIPVEPETTVDLIPELNS